MFCIASLLARVLTNMPEQTSTPARPNTALRPEGGEDNTEVREFGVHPFNERLNPAEPWHSNPGVTSYAECSQLPSNLQAGCHWRWQWCAYFAGTFEFQFFLPFAYHRAGGDVNEWYVVRISTKLPHSTD